MDGSKSKGYRIAYSARGVEIAIYMFLSLSILGLAGSSDPKDYCLHEWFNATCPPGHVVLMVAARYGRMQSGRCISADYGHMGCSSSVVGFLDGMCSGKRECSVSVRQLVDVRPCRKDFMSYLEASYSCVKVPTANMNCPRDESYQPIREPTGYLTSVGMATSSVGTDTCPWLVQSEPGQKINFSFIDFGTGAATKGEVPRGGGKFYPCNTNIVFEEAGERTEVPACGKKSRERHLYASHGSSVRMHISMGSSSGKPEFLIKYEVTGCPDPYTPPDTYMSRMGAENAVVKCNGSEETWYLTCQGTSWIGQVGNCTKRALNPQTISGDARALDKGFPSHGIVLAVLIGIVLGVFIGAILLLTVHCLRRKRRRKCHRDNALPLMTSRDLAERSRDAKDLDSAYPALLTDMDGQGRVTKHFCDYSGDYVSQHTLRHMGTANTIPRDPCEHALHPLPDAIRLHDPDAVNNAINQLNEQGTLGRKDNIEVNNYPPGMRTPQQGESPTVYFQVDTKAGVRHLHGHACVPVCSGHRQDGRHIACLPDNNFD